MKQDKEQKAKDIIKILQDRMHYVTIHPNGHIKVAGWDFWCTSEKFYHGKTGIKGQGLRKFIKHIEEE